jgi:hypothetical protein
MLRSISIHSVFALLLLLFADLGQAATIAYWRMEQDLNPGPNLRVANEVAGGSSLTSKNAFIDTNLPSTSVPSTGSPNLGSIGSISAGTNEGINASAAAYAALNSDSMPR